MSDQKIVLLSQFLLLSSIHALRLSKEMAKTPDVNFHTSILFWGLGLIRLSDFSIVGATDSKLVCKLHCKWEWKESRILVSLIFTQSEFSEEKEKAVCFLLKPLHWGNVVKIYDMSFRTIYCPSKQNVIEYFLCFLWQWVLIHPSNQLDSEVKMHLLPSSWLICGIFCLWNLS